MKPKILLVEDDPSFIEAVRLSLKGQGIRIVTAGSVTEAVRTFNQTECEFDCFVIDQHLPDGKGADLASHIRNLNPHAEVVFATGDKNSDTLATLLETGCGSFIAKGTSNKNIEMIIKAAIQRFRRDRMLLKPLTPDDQEQVERELAAAGFVGRSTALYEVYQKVLKVRDLPVDVLVLGETGVGKELVVNAIGGGNVPVVAVNCGLYSSSDHFIERNLFGCVKGAFTGADSDQRGIFENAAGGIVFLDEIHTLNSHAQSSLLRVLQEKKFRRMGDNSSREIPLKCRIVYGGKPDIERMVEAGLISPDFYFRIKKHRIFVPALRDRVDDIEPLVRHFTGIYSKNLKRKRYFRSDTLPILHAHAWPGNVRDLENMVADLIVDVEDEIITAEHLRKYFGQEAGVTGHRETEGGRVVNLRVLSESFSQIHITEALKTSINFSEAARKLGMKRTTLISRCKRLGIKHDSYFNKGGKDGDCRSTDGAGMRTDPCADTGSSRCVSTAKL